MPLTNGGFESGSFTPWTVFESFGATPQVWSDEVRAGTYAGLMASVYTTVGPLRFANEIRQSFSATPGEILTFSGFAKVPTSQPATSSVVRLRLYVDPGDGVFQQTDVYTQQSLSGSWVAVGETPIAAVGSSCRVAIRLDNSLVSNGTFYAILDDFDVSHQGDAVARGMFDGWTALKTALAGINGASGGYWNDFSGSNRVLTRLVLPDEAANKPNEAYLCVPFVSEEESFEAYERNGFRGRWNQTIFAYVPEASKNPSVSSAAEAVTKVRDDLVRCLANDPTLSDAVQEVELVGGRRLAGWEPGSEFGEYQLVVRINQIFDGSDLGPDA